MISTNTMAYEGQRVTIIGLGREGIALARYLAGRGAKVTVTDIKGPNQLQSALDELAGLPIRYLLGGHPREALDTNVIFVSPGVPKQIPLLREAQERGIELSSETKLFFSLCPAPIIGITGSSGKTTTTALVGEIMKAQGRRTFVGGNIGSPLINLVDHLKEEDSVVMELSSFQLAGLDQSPHIAALLNLSPNHLDRHESMDDYVAAKTNIIRFQGPDDHAILNADQPLTRELARLCRGQVALFSRERQVDAGAFLDKESVVILWKGETRTVCDVSEIKLLGPHNVDNVLAACAISAAAGAKTEAMGAAVASFEGVEHRLEFVTQIGGGRYYDDSIATSPQRAIAALNSFADPIILLAGGRDKRLPLEELAQLILAKVKALILFGEAAPLLEQAVMRANRATRGERLPIYRSADMGEAVLAAAKLAKEGDVVLLSPACTSFDMYKDFAERGAHFQSLVRDLEDSQQRTPACGR
ncbi:MAG: UDP-N-acetylmuramoyl-L-alanine--D-glutamate ligase [Anaerolineae bacterium]|nr:UDP-N-acetylmuramoyl-L-alanine--D-glutamate ligase [Anaerolineae bacterium]